MRFETIRLIGAVLLFVGIVGFGFWDLTHRGNSTDSKSAIASLADSFAGKQSGYRTSWESEEDFRKFQEDNAETFKSKLGSRDGNDQLVNVAYFSDGQNMAPTGADPFSCPKAGWYYVTQAEYTLSCGAHGVSTTYETCGASRRWDKTTTD